MIQETGGVAIYIYEEYDLYKKRNGWLPLPLVTFRFANVLPDEWPLQDFVSAVQTSDSS